ncbi:MAG: response regulator [Spirochaetales bacterium]|nr:response regulator [Spirochaetales bacterium]
MAEEGKDLYKIILVDDEDEVRGRISSKISEESGFVIVGTAGNGYDALELIEKLSPAVVLTDIRMPFIDGIELASLIRRDYPTVRVAFISGYDEFEYAREAIELNVSSYLTKPVTQEDISRFLTRLKGELDREFKEKYNLERLQRSYEENLPLLMDNSFTAFLVSSGRSQMQAREDLRSCGVELDGINYLVVQVQVEDDGERRDLREFERMKHALRSLIGTTLERREFSFKSFRFSEGIFFLIEERNRLFLKEIDPVFFEIVKLAEKFLSLRINIGISRLRNHFRQLNLAYEESCKALDHSRFLNAGRIVYIDQLDSKGNAPAVLSLTEGEIKTLEQTIRFGSDSEVRDLLDSLKMAGLRNAKGGVNFRMYAVNLVDVLVKYAAFVGVDLNSIAGEDVLEKLIRFRSLDQVFDWVLSLAFKLREWNLDTRRSGSQKILDRAVHMIEQNFNDPRLSLDDVCEELGISVSYLSLLFRKNMDTTFVKYLTKIRIDKACELLRLTGDKIVDIAGQCGYNDVYYFSHSFKKSRGVSPKKYREETLS